MNLPLSQEVVCVEGELDFETDTGIVEVKCHNATLIPDEDWIQVIIYDRLYNSMHSQNTKRDLYIYNAITGDLWKRSPK